jgi:nicotinate-nucleotide adenylyltransferase
VIRALLGGSFDPVHTGHVALARHVLGAGLAERIVVVPAWRSPWREQPLAAPEDRLAMCRLAFADLLPVTVDDREVAAGRPVYAVETLAALAAEHPGDAWRLLVGADHLATFPHWREAPRLLELAELLVVPRAGVGTRLPSDWPSDLPPARIRVAPPFDHPVSSSAVRAMLAAGGATGDLLPPAVAAYIDTHRLYRPA